MVHQSIRWPLVVCIILACLFFLLLGFAFASTASAAPLYDETAQPVYFSGGPQTVTMTSNIQYGLVVFDNNGLFHFVDPIQSYNLDTSNVAYFYTRFSVWVTPTQVYMTGTINGWHQEWIWLSGDSGTMAWFRDKVYPHSITGTTNIHSSGLYPHPDHHRLGAKQSTRRVGYYHQPEWLQRYVHVQRPPADDPVPDQCWCDLDQWICE